MPMIRKRTSIALALGLFTLIYLITVHLDNIIRPKYVYGTDGPLYDPSQFSPGIPKLPGENYTRVLVTGRLMSEDISWLSREHPDLPTKIYTVDDDISGLPMNKGNEAMVYLTYIIDHYDNLPDVVLFFHPHAISWHNNILLDTDTSKTIRLLSDAHVVRQGYFNTRCHLDPGCPNWLHIDRPHWRQGLRNKPEEAYLTEAVFHELHGADIPIPPAISQPCCAQFAVSGARIRQRPREDYVRYRTWLMTTDLPDKISGRLMEYSWQYIFTGEFEFCPSQHSCYCDGYGICFEGEARLRDWLALLAQTEPLNEKLVAMWDDGIKGGDKYMRLLEQTKQQAKVLEQLRDNAIQRGLNPKIRAEECGREWRNGDGF
ncbi:hypothetical protein PV11_04270 [Exophiala sideris]|uniref:DUF3431 domain-containing protein n=1 Tax=Exophiala sideris TaxID=1016849 RepID=A0A0D1YH36_9EURO|nr:hypothetical protein PV11_04270 [Exophiala sideris]